MERLQEEVRNLEEQRASGQSSPAKGIQKTSEAKSSYGKIYTQGSTSPLKSIFNSIGQTPDRATTTMRIGDKVETPRSIRHAMNEYNQMNKSMEGAPHYM